MLRDHQFKSVNGTWKLEFVLNYPHPNQSQSTNQSSSSSSSQQSPQKSGIANAIASVFSSSSSSSTGGGGSSSSTGSSSSLTNTSSLNSISFSRKTNQLKPSCVDYYFDSSAPSNSNNSNGSNNGSSAQSTSASSQNQNNNTDNASSSNSNSASPLIVTINTDEKLLIYDFLQDEYVRIALYALLSLSWTFLPLSKWAQLLAAIIQKYI